MDLSRQLHFAEVGSGFGLIIFLLCAVIVESMFLVQEKLIFTVFLLKILDKEWFLGKFYLQV